MTDGFDPYYKWLGIPPADQPPHHYRLLAIKPFEKDPDVIANAADRQMAHLRTFQAGKYAELSQRLLNEVSAARLCLLSADKKAAYDEQLRAKVKPKQSKIKPESAPRSAEPLPAQPLAQPTAFPLDLEFEMPSYTAQNRNTGTIESAKKPHSAAAIGARRTKKSSAPVLLYVGLGSVAAAALVIGLVVFMSSGRAVPVAKKDSGKRTASSHDSAPFDVTKFDKAANPPARDIPGQAESKQLSSPAAIERASPVTQDWASPTANERDDGNSVVIDNGDPNYSATGNWLYYSGSLYFDGDVNHIDGPVGTSSDVAVWTFSDLAPGTYLVENYVVNAENRATNVTIKIYDGATEIASVTQDQHHPTIEQMWEKLGEVTIRGTTLVVKMFGNGNGQIMADAARITPLEVETDIPGR